MLAIVVMAIGALLIVAGAALIFWPAAVVVAGVILLTVGADLARPTRRSE